MIDQNRAIELAIEQLSNVVDHCYQPNRLHCSGCQGSLELALQVLRSLKGSL